MVPVLLWDLSHAGLSATAASHAAIATSLAVTIFNALNNTQAHAQRSNLRRDMQLRFAPFVGLGAVIGVPGSGWLNVAVLRSVFVALLVCTLIALLVRRDIVGIDSRVFTRGSGISV